MNMPIPCEDAGVTPEKAERDELERRIIDVIPRIEDLLMELSRSSIPDEIFSDLSRVRDMLATGGCKPDYEC